MLNALVDGINTDPVGDKVGRILGVNNAFAEPKTDKSSESIDHGRIRLATGNNLQQAHVTRRVEKVGDQEILTHLGRQAFSHGVN